MRSIALSHRALLAFLVVAAAPAVLVEACGGSGETGSTGKESSTGTAAGGAGGRMSAVATGTEGSGGLFNGDASSGCITAADCDGGVCVDGICCATAAGVCGSLCCTGGTVCLFDKCVVPGKACQTPADCDPGQYCETALGSQPDGGLADSGCSQPLPLQGKCLDLPPVCDSDAGAPAPDAGCVAQCEYHPPPGNLDAVVKWSWGQSVGFKPGFIDVWSTPTVGRVYDSNCDGKVDLLDPPNIVFISGHGIDSATGLGTCCQCTNTVPTACHTGVLRVVDGRTGQDVWSLDKASPASSGFSGVSVALADIDGDGRMNVVAVTGEGYVVILDDAGKVLRQSDKPIPGNTDSAFGWGGGLSIADMDGDGFPEIAFGATVFDTTGGKITRKFIGAAGIGGGGVSEALSTFVDLDGKADKHLELLAGNTAYLADGTILWSRPDLPDGFPGVGDFNLDGKPDVVLVGPVGSPHQSNVWILDGATGKTLLGPVTLPTLVHPSDGGPPTVADFDGDGKPEIGVATAEYYWMLKPDFMGAKINIVWKTPNHDFSSSVTGSTVFDFEGDGKAEVIYADECFLWVFDGQTGAVRFAAPHTSFTGTEASLVADVDGDGHAEIVMVTNSADPGPTGWKCLDANNTPVTLNGVTWTPGTEIGKSYRGLYVFGDATNSWVGTRTLWSEHTYHVSNICDDRDNACDAPNVYGSVPTVEKGNWSLPWLNNFRQNVQDKGIFDAPDATVSLAVDCADPVVLHPAVRNIGLASLPTGVDVGLYKKAMPMDILVGQVSTTHALFPGQTEELVIAIDPAMANKGDSFVARILIDPKMPKFHECRSDNDESQVVKASCVQ